MTKIHNRTLYTFYKLSNYIDGFHVSFIKYRKNVNSYLIIRYYTGYLLFLSKRSTISKKENTPK